MTPVIYEKFVLTISFYECRCKHHLLSLTSIRKYFNSGGTIYLKKDVPYEQIKNQQWVIVLSFALKILMRKTCPYYTADELTKKKIRRSSMGLR